jgi:hypothetical protein
MAVEFDHVAVESTSIERDIAFFRNALPGLQVLYSDPTWGLLSAAGVKLALVTPKEHPPHLAFRVNSREELEKLATSNHAQIETHRDQSESFYLQAPGGAWVEIVFYPQQQAKTT